MGSATNINVFDEVMVEVGDSGKFQNRFNILFNFVFVFFATMASCNSIIALGTPEHWCRVPGHELTNYSLDRWKQIHIPR